MKYDIQFTKQFKKDLKLAKKQNKKLDKLFEVIDILANGGTLDAKYRDHDLTGNYKGTRECHIEPDWLLIYEILRRLSFAANAVKCSAESTGIIVAANPSSGAASVDWSQPGRNATQEPSMSRYWRMW